MAVLYELTDHVKRWQCVILYEGRGEELSKVDTVMGDLEDATGIHEKRRKGRRIENCDAQAPHIIVCEWCFGSLFAGRRSGETLPGGCRATAKQYLGISTYGTRVGKGEHVDATKLYSLYNALQRTVNTIKHTARTQNDDKNTKNRQVIKRGIMYVSIAR